jgi:hypothetical protein
MSVHEPQNAMYANLKTFEKYENVDVEDGNRNLVSKRKGKECRGGECLLLLAGQDTVLTTAAGPDQLDVPYSGVIDHGRSVDIIIGTLCGLVVC